MISCLVNPVPDAAVVARGIFAALAVGFLRQLAVLRLDTLSGGKHAPRR
jgi:hypothetical protein